MKKVLWVYILFVFVCGVFFGGCGKETPNEYALDSIYENAVFSVCYPSELFYPQEDAVFQNLIAFEPLNLGSSFSISAIIQDDSKFGDIENIKSVYGNTNQKNTDRFTFKQIHIDDTKSIQVLENMGEYVQEFIYLPFDGWQIIIRTKHPKENQDAYTNIVNSLRVFDPLPDIKALESGDIPKKWQKVGYETDSNLIKVEDRFPNLVGKVFDEANKVILVDSIPADFEETTQTIRNCIHTDIPDDWVMLSYAPWKFTLTPLDQIDSNEVENGGKAYISTISNLEIRENFTIVTTVETINTDKCRPKITININKSDSMKKGDINLLKILEKKHYAEVDSKRIILCDDWACESIETTDDTKITRFDIPYDGWLATVRVYGELENTMVAQILDSLSLNPDYFQYQSYAGWGDIQSEDEPDDLEKIWWEFSLKE